MSIDFMKHFFIRDEGYKTSCWIWKGTVDTKGYGQIYKPAPGGRRVLQAHREFYRFYKSEIPTGCVIDHLCKVNLCVNPDHLEAVTNEVNIKRGKVPKISQDIADKIRDDYVNKRYSILGLQNVYHLSRSSIYYVINRTTWKG